MTSEQAIANEVIAKAVVEVTRAAIWAMAAAVAERAQRWKDPKQADLPWNSQPSVGRQMTNTVNLKPSDRAASNGKKLGRQNELQVIESLKNAEKDTCSTLEGLFKMLTSKFRPQSMTQ